MAKIIMFLLESIVISTLLYSLYLALFRGKASYVGQRVMLISIPIIATILASISFDLIELGGYSKDVVERVVANSDTIVDSPSEPREIISAEGFRVIRTHVRDIGIEELVYLSWAAISLILLVLFFMRLSQILSLRKIAECEKRPDFSIYRFSANDILFSFWRSVYICKDLEGAKLDFILSHELSHIRRLHYIDKVIVEILTIVLWFNPIVRIIQRELSLVHEYEADNSVVESGCSVKAYKMFIFEEATATVPAFANGLNGSQIKKRFIAMSQGYSVKHRALRRVLTVTSLSLMTLTSLVYVEASESNKNEAVSYFTSVAPSEAIDEDKVVERAPSIDARADQLFLIDREQKESLIYVVRQKDHTKVYIGFNVLWGLHWFSISDDTALIDPATGDQYMIHSCASGLPLSKVINVRNQEGRVAYFEMTFPPLDKNVSMVNFREWPRAETTAGYNRVGIGWYFPRIKVSDELPFFAKQ